jgi:hypothetical protein
MVLFKDPRYLSVGENIWAYGGGNYRAVKKTCKMRIFIMGRIKRQDIP